MRKFLLGLAVLVVALAAIVALIPLLVPAEAFKKRIEAEASKSLGREVSIGEDVSFEIFPQAAFRVADLEIANEAGFEGAYLARVDAASIGVKLLPLLSRNVEISRFVLEGPKINLVRAETGAINWNLAAADAPGGPAGAEDAPSETGGAALRDLRLGDVRITDGEATYRDDAAGQSFTLDAINLRASLDSLDEPFTLEGAFNFQGAPSRADIVVTTLGGILRKETANVKVEVNLAEAQAGADLAVQSGEAFSWRGPVRLDAPDLGALAKLFDAPLEEAPGLDRLAVEGEPSGDAERISLTGAQISFDAIEAEGDLTLDMTRARPKARGNLTTELLDLRPYMPPPTETADGFPAWSEAKMDFSSLRNMDADLDVASGQILLNGLKIDSARMKVTINNGRMVADIPEIALYRGSGSGRLVVNARSATPSFAGEFDLSAVDAQPFALDLMKTDRLLGLGAVTVAFEASGSSQAEIMRSVDGKGGFDFADGAIRGINVAKLARAAAPLREGLRPDAIRDLITEARGADQQTDYTNFLTKFDMQDGLITAPTISLDGPFLTLTGDGDINLPEQTIDLRLNPRASTSAEAGEGRSVAIPLRVTGTFSEPAFSIDAERLVRGRVETEVRDLIGGALGEGSQEGEAASSILKDALGGDKKEDDAADGEKRSLEEDVAKRAIDQLFGREKKEEDPPQEDDPGGRR